MTSRPCPGSTSVVLLFLLLLLTPRAGVAAEDAPLLSQDAAPTTLARDSNTEERGPSLLAEPAYGYQRKRAPLALRLLAEVGGGVGTTLAGGLAGFVVCPLVGGPHGEWGCLAPVFIGLAVGLGASPLGVWWGGEAVGGDGSLWAAFGGGTVGLLAGGLLVSSINAQGMVAVIPVLSLLGASLAYELSQRPEHPERSAAHPRIQPLVAFDARGGMLGLMGRF